MNSVAPIKADQVLSFIVHHEAGARIDRFLHSHITAYSRTFVQRQIKKGYVICNGVQISQSNHILKTGDHVTITFPPVEKIVCPERVPDDYTVEVIHTHPDFIIINKPAGLLVHKATSADTQMTLCDWLAKHFSEITSVGQEDRPGIVHRLDQNSSGLMIIPRNTPAHILFEQMFRNRTIKKGYYALVKGHPEPAGAIDFPIARSTHHKHKMTHTRPDGRLSHTDYTVEQYFKQHALVHARPVTGRTHQIRVHFAAIGHPLVGDSLYNIPSPLIDRHALHAQYLNFIYQDTEFNFETDMPSDMRIAIDQLEPIERIDQN